MKEEYKLIIPMEINDKLDMNTYLPIYLSYILGSCTGLITAAPQNSLIKIFIEIDVINVKLNHEIFNLLKRKNLTLEILNMKDKFDKIKFSFEEGLENV